jgi:hypothetical protein
VKKRFNPFIGNLDFAPDNKIKEVPSDPPSAKTEEAWVLRIQINPTDASVLTHTLLQIGMTSPGVQLFSGPITHTLLHFGLTMNGPLVSYKYVLRYKTLSGHNISL